MIRNNWGDFFKATGVVTAIGGFIALLVFSPALTFGCAYIGGMILKLCVGDAISSGLNLVFDTSRFTPDFIPLACATLATIGRYFKSTQTNNDK